MTSLKRFAAGALRILCGIIIVALIAFVLGFIGGYIFWFPNLKTPRIEQAFDVALFVTVVSFVLDPVLFFTWSSLFKKKRDDKNDT